MLAQKITKHLEEIIKKSPAVKKEFILDDDEDIFLGSSGEEMDFPLAGDSLNAVDEEIRNSQIELADIDLQHG